MGRQIDDTIHVTQDFCILVYVAKIYEIRKLDDSGFETFLNRVPDWRRQRILSYRNRDDRARSLACSLLLAEGCTQLGWNPEGFTGENGRPMLSEDGHYISLAHAGDYAVVAFSEEPVGIDIEGIGRFTPERMEKIGKKILTGAEREWLEGMQAVEFARIWTRKEAFVKRNGKGLSMDFREIETLQEDLFYSCNPGAEYVMSTCGSQYVIVKELRISD